MLCRSIYKDTRLLASKCTTMVQAVLEGAKPEINDTTQYDNHKLVVPSYLCTPVAVDKNGNTQTTTTNIPDTKIVWHFIDAGFDATTEIQYYYLCNNTAETGTYLYMYYGADKNIYLKSSSDFSNASDADKENYKFNIQKAQSVKGEEYPIGLNILPKTNNSGVILKPSGNNDPAIIKVSANDGDYQHIRSRWLFVPSPSDKKVLSAIVFASTGGVDVKYYKIQNVNTTTRNITSSRADGYVSTTTSTTDAQVNWYLIEVTDDTDTWLTYYYLINGETGKYLYYSGTSAGSGQAVKMKEYNPADAEKYKFIIVKTANTDSPYNIIPKLLKDEVNQVNISLHSEDNDNALKTANSRNNNKSQWTFIQNEDYVAPPVIVYNTTTNKVEMSSSTTGTVTIQYTFGDGDPNTAYPYGGLTVGADNTYDLQYGPVYTIKATATKGSNSSTIVSKEVDLGLIAPTITVDPSDNTQVTISTTQT